MYCKSYHIEYYISERRCGISFKKSGNESRRGTGTS